MEAQDLYVSSAAYEDVADATALINLAYSIWKPLGFKPGSITEENVASYFVSDGITYRDGNGKLVGVICRRDAVLSIDGKKFTVERPNETGIGQLDEKVITAAKLQKMRLRYVYGLAVDPALGKQGIGYYILNSAAETAEGDGYSGLLGETTRDAKWLLEWYKKTGWKVIGSSPKGVEPPKVFILKQFR